MEEVVGVTKVDADTIVAGVDSSESSEVALGWALDEARRSGRRVLVVAVWHWSSDVMSTPMALLGHQDVHTMARHTLERAAKRATQAGVPTVTLMLEGLAVGALTDIAKGAAMLVVGRHGRGMVERTLMGSVSKGCVQQAQVPVVVVPLEVRASRAAGEPSAQPHLVNEVTE